MTAAQDRLPNFLRDCGASTDEPGDNQLYRKTLKRVRGSPGSASTDAELVEAFIGAVTGRFTRPPDPASGIAAGVRGTWAWPASGRVSSGFGMRTRRGVTRPHQGIDIVAPAGAAVRTPAPGRVVFSGRNSDGYGEMVVIDHGHRTRTRYAHLSVRDVVVGQRVEAGQVIGKVGSTGESTGPHLHVEILVDGRPVDPREFFVRAEP